MTGWETVFSTPWISVKSQPMIDSHGCANDKPYYKLSLPDGVVILPITIDGRILLIRQYRQALGRETVEFPAGNIDPGETPEAAVRRELYEETGYRCRSADQVLSGALRLDRENARNYFFVGYGAQPDPDFQADEPISTLLLEPTEFRQMVLSGGFDHIVALPILLLASWKFGLEIA